MGKHTVLYDGKNACYTTEYSSWRNMINRCSPKHFEAQYYYALGISICKRWIGSDGFLNFYADMGRKPSAQYTIDRIDVTKGYSPDNCRWATKSQQAINRKISSRNTSGFKGVHWYPPTKKWVAAANKITLGYFYDIEEAALAYDCAAIQFYGSEAKLNLMVL